MPKLSKTVNKSTLIISIQGVVIAALLISIAIFGVRHMDQIDTNEKQVAQLNAQIAQQRNDKDTISFYWEEQAAQNDALIRTQADFEAAVDNLIRELNNTIRFINGDAQLRTTATEDTFNQAQSQVLETQTKVNNQVDISVQTKEEQKSNIDEIYLEAGEDLKNRANPRDGIR